MDSNYDGGGWTLILTSSDDGQDTWTWNNRHYFDTDTTTFGSLTQNCRGTRTVSTGNPAGGSDGDIWYKY